MNQVDPLTTNQPHQPEQAKHHIEHAPYQDRRAQLTPAPRCSEIDHMNRHTKRFELRYQWTSHGKAYNRRVAGTAAHHLPRNIQQAAFCAPHELRRGVEEEHTTGAPVLWPSIMVQAGLQGCHRLFAWRSVRLFIS